MSRDSDVVRTTSRVGGLWGFAVIVIGMACIVIPWVPGLGVTLMIGIALIAVGIAQALYAFESKSFGAGAARFIFSLLAILAGLSLVAQPGVGLATITLLLAIWFFIDGIWSLVSGFKWRPFEGWGWMVFSGVVSVILGVMIYQQFPVSATWLVGVLVGIRLVFAGWTMVAMGLVGEAIADDAELAAEAGESSKIDDQA
jgi:uncharacterized membrane protein HdeD (DUF308 family)